MVDRQRVVHDFAIGPDEEAILELRFPPGQLETTLALLQWFGTLGGRSRNGWGSLQLEAQDDTPPLQPLSRGSLKVLGRVVRPWAECLMCEWPHAIGSDEEGPLVWVGSHRRTWQDALSDLAMAKKDFRGALPLDSRRTGLQRRHLLAYPVKEPIVRSWESEARLANQIRFKVKREEGGYRAIIAYVPCRLPGELYEKISDNEKRLVDQDSLLAWRTVIVSLNKQNAFRRIA